MRTFNIYLNDIMANPTKYTLAKIEQICFDRPEELDDRDRADLIAEYVIACACNHLIPVTGY